MAELSEKMWDVLARVADRGIAPAIDFPYGTLTALSRRGLVSIAWGKPWPFKTEIRVASITERGRVKAKERAHHG